MFAFRTLLERSIPTIENRDEHFGLIRDFICCFIFAFGILLVPSVSNACTEGTEVAKKAKIASELFDGAKGPIKSDHNSYKCNFEGDPYKGSHSGWDVAFQNEINQAFYSLTSGIVISAGEDSENTIAIYDPVSRLAVLYLHADYVNEELKIGDCIASGKFLGNQGNTSFWKVGVHVHVEVRKLPASISFLAPIKVVTDNLKQPSHGTDDAKRPTIDPIPHLYRSVKDHDPTRFWTIAGTWGKLKGLQ